MLPAALLLAGEQQQLWNSLDLSLAAAQATTLQQQLDHLQGAGAGPVILRQSQQQQRPLKTVADRAPASQPQEEEQEEQQAAARLQRYTALMQYMAVLHNWRARALAARTTRCVCPLLCYLALKYLGGRAS